MNREQTKAAAEVMLHYANGGEVEYRRNESREWGDTNPIWDWSGGDYRIKRVPREFWIHGTDTVQPHVEGLSMKDKFIEAGFIRVREVIEGEGK